MAITVRAEIHRVLVVVPVSAASFFKAVIFGEAWLLYIKHLWFHSTIVVEECFLIDVSLSDLVVLEASFNGLSSVCGYGLQRNGLVGKCFNNSSRVPGLRNFHPVLIAWAVPFVFSTTVQSQFKVLATTVDWSSLFLCSISDLIDCSEVTLSTQLGTTNKLWLSTSKDVNSVVKSCSEISNILSGIQILAAEFLGHCGC